ncbi:flagellar motor switch protein FliG [Ectobacillus antri]|jgi:hypothetical protein|uniref:Flagellar motor switch protein FliG n=1 Tax=Ectobacillus antri TaxID=2486280 RepID=A0ABT6H137_9BACI|nr:flagellar motor switch protein FliG [Ectobacillus antri]MDG4656184.1 flagellar motor switch protein FliG [Ectobacillus antri]MDG5752859.1 flagellar motor switch protein FliG [Ectobacillus antri]
MNLFVCGSNQLTSADKKVIRTFLKQYAPKHSIHVLCYKSIENEVLRFFLENETYAPHLHIYTFQPFANMTAWFQDMVSHFLSLGAHYTSFNHVLIPLYRSDYVQYTRNLVKQVDLVVCFYNGDTHKSVIAADIAKENGIDTFICDLPGEHTERANRQLERMLRLL